MSDIIGAEARKIAEYGDGEVFDYPMEHNYMVCGSLSDGTSNAAFGGRPRTLEEAIELRDQVIASGQGVSSRGIPYDVFEIVELVHIVRHRVVDTKAMTNQREG